MATPAWWNTNAHREYPLAEGQAPGLPHSAIVDIGLIAGPESGFLPGVHRVWLASVRRTAVGFVFTIMADAPGLIGRPLVFVRPPGDGYSVLDPEPSADSSTSADPCPVTLWDGFLVAGPTSELQQQLPALGDTWEPPPGLGRFEPTVVVSLAQAFVTRVRIFNDDRTRVTPPEDCPPVVWPVAPRPVWVWPGCVQGDLVLMPGFSATAEAETDTTRIVWRAEPGGGEGWVCQDIPLHPAEQPPPDSPFLSGGPSCRDVVRSISGASGPDLQIFAGPGFRITTEPILSRIVIDSDLGGLLFCDSLTAISEIL